MTFEDLKQIVREWEKKREHSAHMWAKAEEHLRLAEQCNGDARHSASDLEIGKDDWRMQALNLSDENVRGVHAARAKHLRIIGLSHLHVAKAYAKASGLDVSGIEIPEE